MESKSTSLHDAFLAVEILVYLCDHQHIESFATVLSLPVRKQKMAAAFDIVSMFWYIWHIGRSTKKVSAIIALQRNWRNKRKYKLCGPYPYVEATNDTDPFTMEPLSSFEPTKVFSFWELSGKAWRVYGFSGDDLFKHIYAHDNPTNPLTRESIPEDIIDRLDRWHRAYGDSIETNIGSDNITFATPGIAFTQVSSELFELHGIEVQPSWLINLTVPQFRNIIIRYRQLTDDVAPHLHYMRDGEIGTASDIVAIRINIAREMLHMIRNEAAPSYIVCCFVFAISQVCLPLHESLPDWVIDAAM